MPARPAGRFHDRPGRHRRRRRPPASPAAFLSSGKASLAKMSWRVRARSRICFLSRSSARFVFSSLSSRASAAVNSPRARWERSSASLTCGSSSARSRWKMASLKLGLAKVDQAENALGLAGETLFPAAVGQFESVFEPAELKVELGGLHQGRPILAGQQREAAHVVERSRDRPGKSANECISPRIGRDSGSAATARRYAARAWAHCPAFHGRWARKCWTSAAGHAVGIHRLGGFQVPQSDHDIPSC